MTNTNLLQAMGRIDPKLIADAAPDVPQKKSAAKMWGQWGAIAACAALFLLISLILLPSMIEDISSDKFDNTLILGGITVHMSGFFWAFFIAPIFSIVCTFSLWLIESGSIILPIWLFRDLCIPLLHFCILRYAIKKNKIQKWQSIVLVVILLLATVALDSFVLEYLILNGRLAVPHIVFRLIWAILCGMFVLGHTLVERFYRNNIRCNIMVAVGSTIALCINAFMTYLLAPTLATEYAIDGIELLLMPLSIIMLSVYSHLLGRIMTKRMIFLKLAGWLLGILASEFVTLWLLGTPRILPTEDTVTTIIWIVVSAFVFIWCLIGVLKTHLEDIKQYLTKKMKPRNRTWVKWASLAACFCFAIMTAVIGGHSSDIYSSAVINYWPFIFVPVLIVSFIPLCVSFVRKETTLQSSLITSAISLVVANVLNSLGVYLYSRFAGINILGDLPIILISSNAGAVISLVTNMLFGKKIKAWWLKLLFWLFVSVISIIVACMVHNIIFGLFQGVMKCYATN